MKQNSITNLILIILISGAMACGGSGSDADDSADFEKPQSMLSAEPKTLEEAEKGWETNIGIGPVKELSLPADIDESLVAEGQTIYEAKCTACHKADKQFIGPAPKGIMERRTPEWVMNMIINPEEMIQKDPIAKQLLIKFNGAPMANQNLTEQDARAVLEYFRTL